MKKLLLVILVFSLCGKIFSQNDSVSNKDTTKEKKSQVTPYTFKDARKNFKERHKKSHGQFILQVDTVPQKDSVSNYAVNNVSEKTKSGAGLFVGLGNGGDEKINWAAVAIAGSFHYKWHTVTAFGHMASKRGESDSHFSGSYDAMRISSGGIIYGPGFFKPKFFVSCGIGIGGFSSYKGHLIYHAGSAPGGSPKLVSTTREATGFCAGLQTGYGRETVKFTIAGFINTTSNYYTYSVLFGLSFRIYNGEPIKLYNGE
ncbi:MAG: hypothetical protein IAF38_05385 [Bacteroidia bacterium]|nr:hypothetical protein [Bacteroidia bacterium]